MASNVILDYAFKVSASSVIPTADTSFLKAVAVVLKPDEACTVSTEGIYTITAKSQFADYTQNANVEKILDIKSWCYVILSDTLDLEDILEANKTNLFTVLISSDFTKTDFGTNNANLKLGTFDGIVGYSLVSAGQSDLDFLEAIAQIGVGFDGTEKNFYHAFSSLLGGASWKNQQYIEMLEAGYDELGSAEYDFEKRLSFVINQGTKYYLGFFANEGRVIIAKYIIKELTILQQSKALSWIASVQPTLNIVNAKLLETKLNEVYAPYIRQGIIDDAQTIVSIDNNQDFVCTAEITITDPRALWRVFANLTVNQ